MSDTPATSIVHWATGPVPCCDEHRRGLLAIANHLGAHVVATKLEEPANCVPCENEKPRRD